MQLDSPPLTRRSPAAGAPSYSCRRGAASGGTGGPRNQSYHAADAPRTSEMSFLPATAGAVSASSSARIAATSASWRRASSAPP